MTSSPHVHDDFRIDDEPGEPYGRDGIIDLAMTGTAIGAAYDGCASCVDAAVEQAAEEPVAVRRLAELAYVATLRFLGSIPDAMTTSDSSGTAYPGPFRAVMRAGATGTKQALPTIVAMGSAERRLVARQAVEVVVGYLPRERPLDDDRPTDDDRHH